MRTRWERAKRDWRVRTMLPIVAIHGAAFLGLYVFTYEFAVREITGGFRVGAAFVLDEGAALFSSAMKEHRASDVREGLGAVARAHRSTALAIFSATGVLRTSVGPGPPFDAPRVAEALRTRGAESIWVDRSGDRTLITGFRVLRNEPSCQACHGKVPSILGAIAIRRDIGRRVEGTAGRLRRAVGYVVLGWIVLVGATWLIRARVIGRPLAQIEKSVLGSAAGGPVTPSHDLDGLAGRVHGAVWHLIERQQERDREVEKGMERVTQLAVLGDVAAGLSHEIKNPLAGIRAALGALRNAENVAPAERADVIDQMVFEVDRVNRTVDSLLSLARPRSLVRTPADPGKVVQRATALLEARARSLGVELSVKVASDLPQMELDSDLVIQVVVNLVTNALDAVRAGGTVRVSVEPFPGRDGAVIAVSDDGEGIPESARARIFEPFFTTKHGGTGLGLPLCLRIVEQHGGTITVESEPGRGTTFVVLLPRRSVPVRKRSDSSGVHPSG